MNPSNTLKILVVAPTALLSLTAQAQDLEDPLRPRNSAEDSNYEDSLDLEYGLEDGRAWVSFGSFYKRNATGASDLGVVLQLGLPLERAQPKRVRVASPSRDALADPATAPTPTPTPGPARPAREIPALWATSKLARACVQAAWRTQGWAGDQDYDALSARSRWSAALPEVRLRAARGWDESFRLTPTDSDPYRAQETNGTSRWLEGRLIWRLDRMLFSDHEIPIERLRLQRAEARSRLAGRVLAALFEWQKAALAALDPALSTQDHLEAVLRQAEAEALLDVLTGGWFSQWLEKSSGS